MLQAWLFSVLFAEATAYIDPPFFPAIVELADELGADAEDLAAVAFAESGIDPRARNLDGCLGINGMCDGTLVPYARVSPATFARLPASRQLVAFGRLLRERSKLGEDTMATVRGIYWVNFLPGSYVAHASDEHVLTCSRSIIHANRLLAHGKPCIVAGDLPRFVAERQRHAPEAWAEILARIDAARREMACPHSE